MVSANLDLVRSIFDAWEHGDFSSVDWADPNIEFAIADGPAPGTWNGITGLVEGWSDLMRAWQDLRSEPEEYLELDDERILVLAHFSGRGKGSGVQISDMRSKGAGLFHVRNAKVTRHVVYWDRDHAFAELGLTD